MITYLGRRNTPRVQDIESLEHQQGKQSNTFPKADREGSSGEGRVEVASRLTPGFGAPGRRLGELHEFVTSISGANGVVFCDIQQVVVESSQ